jgi:hypothetical protein
MPLLRWRMADLKPFATRSLSDAGRFKEALEWVQKRGKVGLKFMTYGDLSDRASPSDTFDLARTRLEIRILETTGDRAGAQDLRWKTFETALDPEILRDHIARLPDFTEFDVLDKAFAHAASFPRKYHALNFFIKWPRFDLAAKLILDRYASGKASITSRS